MKSVISAISLASLLMAGNAVAMSKKPVEVPEPIASDATVSFIAIGDAGTGKDGQYKVAAALKTVCEARGCDFAIGLGDNIYESGVSSTEDEQWQTKFEQPYKDIDFPFYMALGNHDNSFIGGAGLTNTKGENQVDYHYKENRTSDKWNMPARYYTFNAPLNSNEQPLINFFALDSNPLATLSDIRYEYWQLPYRKKQAKWVDAEMKKATAKWKIAFAHHAFLSNGKHNNAGMYEGLPGMGLVYKNFLKDHVCDKVDFMVAGHDHDLQLLRPVQNCGKTVHMVSGAGAKTRELKNRDRNKAYWQKDNTLGFFHFEIQGDQATVSAYTVNSSNGEETMEYQRTFTRQD